MITRRIKSTTMACCLMVCLLIPKPSSAIVLATTGGGLAGIITTAIITGIGATTMGGMVVYNALGYNQQHGDYSFDCLTPLVCCAGLICCGSGGIPLPAVANGFEFPRVEDAEQLHGVQGSALVAYSQQLAFFQGVLQDMVQAASVEKRISKKIKLAQDVFVSALERLPNDQRTSMEEAFGKIYHLDQPEKAPSKQLMAL